MSNPIPQELLNERDLDGALLCPDCRQSIVLNIGAKFVGAYAFHISCGRLYESEDRAREILKHNAQLRDQADVLVRESEAAIERAKQVSRGRRGR